MSNCRRSAERFIISALCVLLLASCGLRQGKTRAEQAVKEFHTMLNKGQYDAIYDNGDAALKKAWSRADFAAYLGDIHFRLGAAGASVTRGFQLNASTGQGTEVALTMETQCERGTAQEHFVWHIEGDKAVLVDYRADVKESPGPTTV